MTLIQHFIAGAFTSGTGSGSLPVTDPATGEQSGTLAVADAATVGLAIAAAEAAFPDWAATPPHVRARVLFRFRDLAERDLDRLAAIITREHGSRSPKRA